MDEDIKPDYRTQPKEWEKWYWKQKAKRYQETHKTVVDWGSEYRAPFELYGAWIETKYERGHGLCFDFSRIKDVSKEILLSVTAKLGEILSHLGDDVDWWSPHVIEVDHKGQCHLLVCSDYRYYEKGRIVTRNMDMILRTGSRRVIRV